ncbi:hypothetical protein O23A_p0616 [Aeromonas salmonicida]|nr:hypothetical protein O23A_p0616 [Aeromonas salmonicida]
MGQKWDLGGALVLACTGMARIWIHLLTAGVAIKNRPHQKMGPVVFS